MRRTALAAIQEKRLLPGMSLEFQQIVGKSVIKPQYSHVEVGHTVSDNLAAST